MTLGCHPRCLSQIVPVVRSHCKIHPRWAIRFLSGIVLGWSSHCLGSSEIDPDRPRSTQIDPDDPKSSKRLIHIAPRCQMSLGPSGIASGTFDAYALSRYCPWRTQTVWVGVIFIFILTGMAIWDGGLGPCAPAINNHWRTFTACLEQVFQQWILIECIFLFSFRNKNMKVYAHISLIMASIGEFSFFFCFFLLSVLKPINTSELLFWDWCDASFTFSVIGKKQWKMTDVNVSSLSRWYC